MEKEKVSKVFDKIILDVNQNFQNMLAARTMYNLGQSTIDQINDNICISPIVGKNLKIEPIQIKEIKEFKNIYPRFILEVFHEKISQSWNLFLNKIFSILLELHFSKKKTFKELKEEKIRLDFRKQHDFIKQIKINMIEDFNFKKYIEKQKLINKALNKENNGEEELQTIHKNILIRNAITHRTNRIDKYMLQQLGLENNGICILDENGNDKIFMENEEVNLSISEIFKYKKSILFISQIWRNGINDE